MLMTSHARWGSNSTTAVMMATAATMEPTNDECKHELLSMSTTSTTLPCHCQQNRAETTIAQDEGGEVPR